MKKYEKAVFWQINCVLPTFLPRVCWMRSPEPQIMMENNQFKKRFQVLMLKMLSEKK